MNPSTPTPRSRIPAIDTNITQDFSFSVASPSTPLYNAIPSLRISVSPRTDVSPTTSPSIPRTQPPYKVNSNNRARTESRKLLAHVLDQLDHRTLPPNIFDVYGHSEQRPENNLGALLQTMKGTVNSKKARQDGKRQASAGANGEEDSDEGEDHEYSTDATCALMVQLKDLLSVSVDQGWHILDDNPSDQQNEHYEASGKPGISPFRRTRNSLLPGSQRDRSRSRSPSISDSRQTHTPELLSSCISILASVVLEDCRFQIASPRPSCPPNALQALTLDVAQFLLHTHRHDPNITSKIGFAMIPAFSTFRPEMHGRLLTFFETAVVRGVLEDLGQIQGVSDIISSPNDFAKPLNSAGSSVVAIHIDAVQEPHSLSDQWKAWSFSPDNAQKLRSTYAPSQSLAVYLMSSLVAPLLATILEFVDLQPKPDARTDVLHRFRRLLRLIIEAKPDAYSDILQIVGYHTHQARRTAVAVMCAVWPKAVGHIVISRPFANLYAPDEAGPPVQPISTEHDLPLLLLDFRIKTVVLAPSPSTALAFSVHSAHARCILTAMTTQMEANTFNTLWFRIRAFTAWQSIASLKSDSNMIARNQGPTSTDTDTKWNELHRSCMEFYSDILKLSYSELQKLSFEEISVIHSTMWIQAQVITSGIALGSIVITRNGDIANRVRKHKIEEFELHQTIRWCEDLLSADRQQCSNAMDDYMEGNFMMRSEHFMMFDWTNLMYIRSIIRSPYTEQHLPHSSSTDLLSVTQPGPLPTSASDGSSSPYDIVPLSHMRDALGHGMNIHSDVIARLLLSQLHHFGLFQRIDHCPVLFNDDDVTDVYCSFPLPFGLDLSPTVEALVAAVEGCLQDLDLSITEVGLLLLSRRLWPNGLSSDYALQRLTRCILSWILAEDDHLAIILRDYLARGRPLPGVRSSQDPISWPSSDRSRPAPSSSVDNGGDYLATRRALLTRYVKPWLLALHDLDPVAYAALIYEASLSVEFAPASVERSETDNNNIASRHDKALRHITRLLHHQIVFTAFDNLFLHWLESISKAQVGDEPIQALPRLFPREVDATNTYATNFEHLDSVVTTASADPWKVITRTAAESIEGLGRGLQWLCLLARSGVDISLATFKTFSVLVHNDGSLATSSLMAKAVMASTWLKPTGRLEIQSLISQLHERLSLQIIDALRSRPHEILVLSFVRISLASCLLLYGCDRAKLSEFGIILESDTSGLPTRRKLNIRGSVVVDPVVIDARLMAAIDHYLAADVEEISCLVGKFLFLFLTDSPYLESYEVDNFILRNGRTLATCAWRLYGIQRPEISELRPHFLLRTLVVDSEPLRNILETSFLQTSSWERRLLAISRLFRIMLDMLSPSFNVEDRQWQSCLSDVFYSFFTPLWVDQREEIRITVETCSATLLPAHLQAISACWNELLSKSPIAERLKLISFLIQLRSYFPRWQVLSWNAIVDALSDDEIDENDPAAARLSLYGLPSASDPDLYNLHMISDGIVIDSFAILKIKHHLVEILGFRDVSVVPSHNGQSFQVQFGEVGEIDGIALPCLDQLLSVMDASHQLEVAPSTMAGADDHDERPVSVLVGSAFVDVFLSLICTVQELTSLPVLTCKNMLETLCVIIYKHDFDNRVLRHLQQPLRRAVMRALECLAQDISYDLRQLALSIVHAFVKRWHSIMGSFIYTAIESIAKIIAAQSQPHGQDALGTQARAFLDTSLTKYAQNGLFANLLKVKKRRESTETLPLTMEYQRPLTREFFLVIQQVTDSNAKSNPHAPQSLRELLLRDLFTRVLDADLAAFQNVLNNTQTYVDVVYHQGFSAEMMQVSGQQLTQFSRRTTEWNPEEINPNPLLNTCATILQHNKTLSRELLPYVDTILRVLLNRLSVDTEGLTRLLHVTNTLHRKTMANDVPITNNVITLLFEVLGDGMRLKTRVLPSTLSCMLEVQSASSLNVHG
ncbi:hypothetical protein DXG01_015894 [Tephrocybe rancida]|nr:hypothetical protein DXG01_015894 [Tephrocybe rancida]